YARVQTVVDTTTMETETVDYRPLGIDGEWEWRSGVTLTLARRTTDRRFHPRMGSYSRLTAELFGGALQGDVEYQRYILDARKFIPSFWGTTLMLRGRTGIVTGYGDPETVPDDTRFELGGVGANGIRGYNNRSILPEGKDLYGGRTMLLGTVELKLPLTSETAAVPIYGLAFLDAGNTWDSKADTHPTDLYWGAGAGVRVEVPVLGNLGIDLGYGLDEEEGGEWVVHYQFGLEY
ncbi:MAG: BamA/TamA family outer membrane protein, partial [Candidatus Eisenbacteria bacterium]|nr:BamA/TamA family outer membrane protein [Candidatus Eisenbacteria bacterium]